MCTRCMYWSTCVKTCKCYRLLPKQVPNSMMISTRNYLLSRDQSSGCYKYFSGGVLSNCVHFHPSGLWSKINTNNLQAHSPLMMDEHPPQNSENHSVVEMTVPFFNASICTLVHERENRIPIFRCSMNTYSGMHEWNSTMTLFLRRSTSNIHLRVFAAWNSTSSISFQREWTSSNQTILPNSAAPRTICTEESYTLAMKLSAPEFFHAKTTT